MIDKNKGVVVCAHKTYILIATQSCCFITITSNKSQNSFPISNITTDYVRIRSFLADTFVIKLSKCSESNQAHE